MDKFEKIDKKLENTNKMAENIEEMFFYEFENGKTYKNYFNNGNKEKILAGIYGFEKDLDSPKKSKRKTIDAENRKSKFMIFALKPTILAKKKNNQNK